MAEDANRLKAQVISPLEGEMSPKATEGVGSTGRDLPRQMEVSVRREATPSGRFAAISPSRGEIPSVALSTIEFAMSISAILHERSLFHRRTQVGD